MAPLRRVKLTDLNAHLVCVLCSGYFVDATTIIECLHTFCKTCIVRYLQTSSFCPICDVQVHKTKPLLSLREDRTLQDVVFKLVPGLFQAEMNRRLGFYTQHPEAGGDKTEQTLRERRHFFHVDDQISLSLEYLPAPLSFLNSHLHPHLVRPLKVSNGQQQQQQGSGGEEETDCVAGGKDEVKKEGDSDEKDVNGVKMVHKRYLRCPAAVQVSHLEKFIRLKYSLTSKKHRVDIMHGGDCLVGELTLLDVVYMYKWTEDAPLRLMYTVTPVPHTRKRPRLNGTRAPVSTESDAPVPKIPRTRAPTPLRDTAHPLSPHVPLASKKGQQDASSDSVEVVSVACSVDSADKMEVEPHTAQPTKCTSSSVVSLVGSSTCVIPTVTSICSQSFPFCSSSSSLASSNSSSSSVNQLSCPTPVRSRPALTTTTPATTTPRVAVAHIPSPPVNPVTNVSVSIAASGPITTSFSTTAPPVTNTQTNLVVPSLTTARMQMQQPAMNGLMENTVRPMLTPGAQVNKMPQPIIPSRPRLGRPPNSSRINNANMKPPVPRLGNMQKPRHSQSGGKKLTISGGNGRGNQIVSASLNVQSRLSSISGPPFKSGSAKVSLKKLDEGAKDNGQVQTQSSEHVTKSSVLPTSLASASSQESHCSSDTQVIQCSSNIQPTTLATQGSESLGTQDNQQSTDAHNASLPPAVVVSQHSVSTQLDKKPSCQVSERPSAQANQQPVGAQLNQRPTLQAAHQVTTTQVNPLPGNSQVGHRPPVSQGSHRLPVTPVHQRTTGTQASQQSTNQTGKQSPGAQGSQQQPPNMKVPQHHQGIQARQQASGIQQSTQSSPGNGVMQRPVMPGNHRIPNSALPKRPSAPTVQQRPPTSSVSQRSPASATSRPPASPAPHRQACSPAPHRQPSSPAPHRQPSSPAPHRQPSSPAPHRQPSSPSPHRPPSSPAPHRQPSSPAPHRQPSSPAPHQQPGSPASYQQSATLTQYRQASTPAPIRQPNSPAPHRQPSSPAPNQQPNSPAPHRQASSPATNQPPGSPSPHQQSSMPAPQRQHTSSLQQAEPPASHRQASSPSPHRQQSSPAVHQQHSSPASHRQPGSMTPRPHSTLTPSIARSTPSPKVTVSSPSPAPVSVTVNNKEITPTASTATNTNSVGSVSHTNVLNSKSAGAKSGVSSSQTYTSNSITSNTAKAPAAKSQPSTGAKASPKSPGRGRGGAGSPTILSIAQTLANRQLQRTTAPPAHTASVVTTTNVAGMQVGPPQVYTSTASSTPVYPGNVGTGLVPPALAAAAYMATAAYADPNALTDVTAMRNLITLSQTAACIREINLAAMVKAAETLPRASDPAPIDLSPTSKAAPQTPLTNGRPHTSTTMTTGTRTTASKSPSSKTPRSNSSSSSNVPTISPPTPEVTITKLPNTPVCTSSTTPPTTGTGKNSHGSSKMASTNTNTVSITKRPASNNRIAVAKSPANASVRQIPNPSFLRHQSEARNNNNITKSVSSSHPSSSSSSSSSSIQSNTATQARSYSSNKQAAAAAAGGKGVGNSPLKETGPLPETSSISKIEHLTRSLPASTASHGFRFFDDR